MSQTASPRRRRWFSIRWLAGFTAAATDLLFPPTCAYCEEPSPPWADGSLLCAKCARLLRQSSGNHRCPRCGMPAPAAALIDGKCGECRHKKLNFCATRSLGTYHNDVRDAVLRIKHHEQEHLAIALGKHLAAAVKEHPFPEPPDLVVPIPMYWLTRLMRGTSAAETLSRSVARAISLPQAGDLLVCRRRLKKQSLLPAGERLENVRGAFAVSRSYNISRARILLVDDVITTGATCDSAAKALLNAGAASVYAVSVARGTGMRT